MARSRDTGDGDEYTEPEIDELWDYLEDAYEDYYGLNEDEDEPAGGAPAGPSAPSAPAGMDVTAQVEWAGTIDANGRNGVRPARLGSRGEQVDLAPVMAAVSAARRERQRAAAGPLKSYTAKGWRAQLRQMQGTKRGQEALRAAGVAPSKETMRRWGKGEQAPSKANRARIAEAYETARNPHQAPAAQLRAEAAGKLTAALRDTYGVNVRFRDIRDMRFRQ